jgi:hypothetical protein
VLLGYLAEGGYFRNTGIGKHDIELALLSFDLCEQAIEIATRKRIASEAGISRDWPSVSSERDGPHREGEEP